ncbi:MAG: MerR family transcriptional regulator [bacterium]
MTRKLDPDKALFTIGTVAEILGIKPRMLRVYEEKGLILPSRSDSNRRLYSLKDIDILAYVQYLSSVKKVNLAGILEIQKIILKMDEASRSGLMEEIEKEISALPSEKKKVFEEGEEGGLVEVLEKSRNY